MDGPAQETSRGAGTAAGDGGAGGGEGLSARADVAGSGGAGAADVAGDGGPGRAAEPGAAQAVDFLAILSKLKTTKRAGWLRHGVRQPESISDHMYRMTIMALIGGGHGGADYGRCMKIAAVHDIAEALVGDITPWDGVSKEEKARREAAAIDELCATLGSCGAADELRELWLEYEAGATPEGKLVKDFDKVEMILQALEYEKSEGKDLGEFFASTRGRLQTDVGRRWAAEIEARRAAGGGRPAPAPGPPP